MEFDDRCLTCENPFPNHKNPDCTYDGHVCPWIGICMFNRWNIPSNAALRWALEKVLEVSPEIVAAQHGSILYRRQDIARTIDLLMSMDDVGIDGVLKGNPDGRP